MPRNYKQPKYVTVQKQLVDTSCSVDMPSGCADRCKREGIGQPIPSCQTCGGIPPSKLFQANFCKPLYSSYCPPPLHVIDVQTDLTHLRRTEEDRQRCTVASPCVGGPNSALQQCVSRVLYLLSAQPIRVQNQPTFSPVLCLPSDGTPAPHCNTCKTPL